MSDRRLMRRAGDRATVVLNAPDRPNALAGASWLRLGAAIRIMPSTAAKIK